MATNQDEQYRINIRNYLIERALSASSDAKGGNTGLASDTENFVRDFLNHLLGCNFQNINAEKRNARSFDLEDSRKKYVAQVSVIQDASKVRNKIKEGLKECVSKPGGPWRYYYVPFHVNAQEIKLDPKAFSREAESGVIFHPKKDFLTIARLLELAKSESKEGSDTIDKLKDLSALVDRYQSEKDNLEIRNQLDGLLLAIWRNHRSFKLMQADEIDLRLLPKVKNISQFTALGKTKEDSIDSPVWSIIYNSWKLPENHPIVIKGGGGIGKTVTLFSLTNMDKKTIPAPAVYVPMFELITEKGYVVDLYDYFTSVSSIYKEIGEKICELSRKPWVSGPSLLILLDGFNEIPGAKRWTVLSMLQKWQIRNPGAQMIAVSRPMDNLDLENHFGENPISIVLSALTEETVKNYLQSIEGERNLVPKPGAPIWKSIIYPLFLNLYIKSECLRKQQTWMNYPLMVMEAEGPGSIIWNYLQRELLRHDDEEWILQCALACEYLTPGLAYYMLQHYSYTISLQEAIMVIQKLVELIDLHAMPKHLSALLLCWKTQNLKTNYPFFLKDLDWIDIVLRETGLLIPYLGSLAKNDGGSAEQRYEFLHQGFRDCLAGVFLINQAEMAKTNELPEVWQFGQSYLAIKYVAELIDSDTAGKLWEANRLLQQYGTPGYHKNSAATYTLLELQRWRYPLPSELQFSGMDLRGLSLTRYMGHGETDLELFRRNILSCKTLLDRATFQCDGHHGAIICLATLPNGNVVSGSDDYSLRIWNPSTGQCIQKLEGHSGLINCVAVQTNGQIVSGSDDNTLRVWDLSTSKCLHVLSGHTGFVVCVASFPDGRIASGSWDGTLRIWNADTGKCIHTLEGHRSKIRCVSLLPGNRLVSGSDDYSLRVWDSISGSCLFVLNGHTSFVNCVSTLIDGSIVSGSSDGTLRIWNSISGKCLYLLKGHTQLVYCTCILPSGNVISGSWDGTLRIWDPNTGNCLKIFRGHTDAISCLSAFPDGRFISGSQDYTLRIWDSFTGQCIQVLRGHTENVYCVTILPDGHIVSGSFDNSLKIWNPNTGQCLQTLEGHKSWILCIASLSNGQIVSGSWDNTLCISDSSSGKIIKSLQGHSERVSCVANLSNDHIISGSWDKSLRVWDICSGENVGTLLGHSARVFCLDVLPDGRVVSGAADKSLRIWDIKSGKCNRILEGHTDCVRCVSVLHGGLIVSGSDDNSIRIWDPNTGKCSCILKGHVDCVRCVGVLHDGRIVSGSRDKTLRIWDPTSGKCLQILNGHTDWVRCVAVSTDGFIISGSDDTSIKLWNPDSGKCLRTLHGHMARVRCLSVLHDKLVISGSDDGTIRIWNLSSGECLDAIESLDVDVSKTDFSQASLTGDIARLLWHNSAIVSEKDYVRWVEPYRKAH